MLQILGIKRILVLVVLISANVALASVTYLYVQPRNTKQMSDLQSIRGQISGKRAEVERLQNEFVQIQQDKNRYEALQTVGFISDQNRLVARRRIGDIQQYTKILRAAYDINSATVVKKEFLDKVGYVVLSSPIKVELEALDDLDLYNFIYWMENAFPGHIALKNIKFERVLDVNEATLRAVGTGASTALVKGEASFVWRTIVPVSEVQVTDEFGGGGL